MAVPITYPAGSRTGIGGTSRTLVQPNESVGRPDDVPATSVNDENSVFALLKGCLVSLGVDVGSGDGDVNETAHLYFDPLATLGDTRDPPASDLTDAESAIALTKGVLARAGL